MAEKKEKTLSFEEALKKLETIVSGLENGTAPLDESLKMFGEGVELIRLCTDKLDKAEQQIKILTKKADGSYAEGDFKPAE